MEAFHAVKTIVEIVEDAVFSVTASVIQVICTVIFTSLAIGWVYAGFVRSRSIWQFRQRSAAVGIENVGPSYNLWRQSLPKLTILMPVAGRRPNTLANWRTLLAMPYPGQLEILLLVHSRGDAAFTAAQELLLGQGGRRRARNSMKIRVTGLTESCSQKVHNLVQGVHNASPDSKYVLCMDDDVRMHPTMLIDLVESLEYDPSSPYMATGCVSDPTVSFWVLRNSLNSPIKQTIQPPKRIAQTLCDCQHVPLSASVYNGTSRCSFPMDVPSSSGAGFPTYSVISFHLHLLVTFSLPKVRSVWGGTMLFRLQDLLDDTCGLMHAWESGGYSDDMICSAIMLQHNKKVVSPNTAVFLQPIEHDISWSGLWNYLCRQMFTLDTYHNFYNRLLNHAVLVGSFAGTLVFLSTVSLVIIKTIFWAACFLVPVDPAHGMLLQWGTDNMLIQALVRMSSTKHCRMLDLPCLAVLISFLFMYVASRWFSDVILTLVRMMAPDQVPEHRMNWPKMWVGMFLQQLLIPFAILRNSNRHEITWAKIRYRIKHGKVAGIEHAVHSRQ